MVQTTYNATMDKARVGSIGDTAHRSLISRICETTNPTDVVGYGVPVSQGAADRGAHATKAGDTAVIGITCRERSGTVDGWTETQMMRVMTEGPIWVEAGVAIAAGEPVHVDPATGNFTNAGGVKVGNARYESSGAAGDLVFVRML